MSASRAILAFGTLMAVSLVFVHGSFAKGPQAQVEPTSNITVKVLKAGAQPRKALRYDFASVKPQSLEMVMKMEMAISLGAFSQPPVTVPPVRMGMRIEPEKVLKDGVLRYRFKLDEATVDESPDAAANMVAAMKTALASTKGLSGWAEVTPRGFTRKAEIVVPPKADPQMKDMISKMKQQIQQMSAPLPAEAVGVGASWVVTQPIKTDELELIQTASYTLKSFDDGVAMLDITIKQDAPPQDITSPAMGGATARLVSLKSVGTGTSRVKMHELIPRAQVKIAMDMRVEIDAGGQKQNMRTDLKLETTISPK